MQSISERCSTDFKSWVRRRWHNCVEGDGDGYDGTGAFSKPSVAALTPSLSSLVALRSHSTMLLTERATELDIFLRCLPS